MLDPWEKFINFDGNDVEKLWKNVCNIVIVNVSGMTQRINHSSYLNNTAVFTTIFSYTVTFSKDVGSLCFRKRYQWIASGYAVFSLPT